MKHEFYFGTFSSYEDYIAIGKTPEEVKAILWKMYTFNYYGKPNKDDRRIFEEEVNIYPVISGAAFGYNTAFHETYTTKGNRLITTKKFKGAN